MRSILVGRWRWLSVGVLILGLGAVLVERALSPDEAVFRELGEPTLVNEVDQPLREGATRGDGHVAPMGWSGFSSDWPEMRSRTTSFGIMVCLAPGTGPVTIDRISALRSVGDGYRTVGWYVDRIGRDEDPFISSPGFARREVAGRPPPGERRFSFVCGTHPLEQLVVGLEAVTGRGGGWRGAVVRYTSTDGRQHTLSVGVEMVMCGTSVGYHCPHRH